LAFAAAASALAAAPVLSPPVGQLTTPGWSYVELHRFPAPEARQGVAVEGDFFFAIGNHAIGKYLKTTGERVAVWDGGEGGEVIHLNAGIVRNGRLYGVHSNYPGVPMLSSLEIFDPETLMPIGSHSFGRMDGSFTWWTARRSRRPARRRVAGSLVSCTTAIAGRNRIVTRHGRRSSPWTTNGGAPQAGRCRRR